MHDHTISTMTIINYNDSIFMLSFLELLRVLVDVFKFRLRYVMFDDPVITLT